MGGKAALLGRVGGVRRHLLLQRKRSTGKIRHLLPQRRNDYFFVGYLKSERVHKRLQKAWSWSGLKYKIK